MDVEQRASDIRLKKRSIEENIEKKSTNIELRLIENIIDNNKIKGNRDDNIYIYHSTLKCILDKNCIPCLYKLFPEGINDRHLQYIINNKFSNPVEYSYPFINSYPKNERPENCIRSKSKLVNIYSENIYNISNYNILTLGDGDFSFSLSLARNKHKDSNIIATSHETKHSLLNTYPQIDTILNQLNAYHVPIIHGVDATSLQDTFMLPSNSSITTFDFIIWNFPCISLPAGADGQSKELQANKELLTSFFLNIYPYLTPSSGEIHITHKTIEPFSWWDIKQIAADCGYEYMYGIVFDRCNYPGYMNRKALDSKSFPCHDAQTYVFIPKEAAILLSNNRNVPNINFESVTTANNNTDNSNNIINNYGNNNFTDIINNNTDNNTDINYDEIQLKRKRKKEYKKTQKIISKWKENAQNKLQYYSSNQTNNILSNLFDNEIIKQLNNYFHFNYQK